MNRQRRNLSSAFTTIIFALGLAVGSVGSVVAQDRPNINQEIEGIKWTVLQQVAFTSMPGKDEIMGIAEIAPGAAAERHSHAEYEIGYVLQGEFDLEIEGEATRTIRVGDSYAIPAGNIHRAKNNGSGPMKVLAIYMVDQGWPLAKPAN